MPSLVHNLGKAKSQKNKKIQGWSLAPTIHSNLKILRHYKEHKLIFWITAIYVALGGVVACSLYPTDELNGGWFFWGWVLTLPVTIILSGNRPQASVAAEKTRYVSIDGRLTDLEGSTSRHLIPLISDNWTKHFQWRGRGPLPVEDKEKLARIVKTTHAQGRKLRFWAVADDEVAWKELLEAGVDVLNTDHLAAMQTFLKAQQH